MIEEWRPIAGYEGRYEISNLGRARSLRVAKRTGDVEREKPLLLKGSVMKSGRRSISLFAPQRPKKMVLVARTVLSTFGSPAPPGMECCHCDGDCTNDNLTNLRWDTHRENIRDVRRHGSSTAPKRPAQGSAHWAASLSEDDARCIRAEPYFRGVGKMLAGAFGTSNNVISCIRNGKTWGHVSP